MNESTPRLRETSSIDPVHQFVETIQDFTDPKEAIREGISNGIDWGATHLAVRAQMDKTKTPAELVLELEDDGIGLNEERLKAFFALGRSTGLVYDKLGNKLGPHIGEKGHGTKTYFNSRQIEVFSNSGECYVYALMEDPLGELKEKGSLPAFEYEVRAPQGNETFTRIVLHGYNENQTRDFAHEVLRDYILWFTKFGSVETQFGLTDNQDKTLTLRGLDRDGDEELPFAHVFPAENTKIDKLKQQYPADWIDYYVKRWIFKQAPVDGFPAIKIDFVFYLEGDEAKRLYNPMIRPRGKAARPEQYKVEERYGIYACKDHIPVTRVNERLRLRRRLETKFHAFVTCNEFRLTANRADIGNTPADLLLAVEETVHRIFTDKIMGSPEYYQYERFTREYKGEVTAERERRDFDRRRSEALKKKVARFRGIDILEPRLEAGVFGLFVTLKTIYPALFPFTIIDYDTSIGYDALVSYKAVEDLTKDSISFVEFKYALERAFDHAFAHLRYIVCWECGLSDGEEVEDVAGRRRVLQVTDKSKSTPYRKYMLTSKTESHNIEVFVLRDYLRDKTKAEFKARAAT